MWEEQRRPQLHRIGSTKSRK